MYIILFSVCSGWRPSVCVLLPIRPRIWRYLQSFEPYLCQIEGLFYYSIFVLEVNHLCACLWCRSVAEREWSAFRTDRLRGFIGSIRPHLPNLAVDRLILTPENSAPAATPTFPDSSSLKCIIKQLSAWRVAAYRKTNFASQIPLVFSSPSIKDCQMIILAWYTITAQNQTQLFCHSYARNQSFKQLLISDCRTSVSAQKEKKQCIIFSFRTHYRRNFRLKSFGFQEKKRVGAACHFC